MTTEPSAPQSFGTFRSLQNPNFRRWALGAFVSNVGTWMQRTAQDWLVLTQLTQHSATSLGIVTGLQFGPQLLLLPITGFAADRSDRRKLLILTQSALGVCALALGLLVALDAVQLWHVYAFAFVGGCVSAFDAPTRQTFVGDVVATHELANAVALNSTSFHAARMVGPAAAGIAIGAAGSGTVFLLNAASFAAVVLALTTLDTSRLQPRERDPRSSGGLLEGFRYVWGRPDLITILAMLLVIGTFGLNFPIFIASMSVRVFHVGATEFGALTSMMALGSVAGALLAARRAQPSLGLLVASTGAFGVACALAAIAPSYGFFGAALVALGITAQTFLTSSNSVTQLSTLPAMRGRVLAILLAIAMGGTPIGGPTIGWVVDRWGARWSLGVGALAGLTATLIGLLAPRPRASGR